MIRFRKIQYSFDSEEDLNGLWEHLEDLGYTRSQTSTPDRFLIYGPEDKGNSVAFIGSPPVEDIYATLELKQIDPLHGIIEEYRSERASASDSPSPGSASE